MGIEQTIPVTLLRSDVAYFVEMAREQGQLRAGAIALDP